MRRIRSGTSRSMKGRRRDAIAAGLLLLATALSATTPRAEEVPPPPRPIVALPAAAIVGPPLKVRIRGQRLEGVTEVRSMVPGVGVTLQSQGKAGLPNGIPADRAGDTQVECELRFDPDLPSPPPSDIPLVLVAPHGEATLRLPLLAAGAGVAEVEPNPGFERAQTVALPAGGALAILGQVERPQDVDVYRIEGAGGRRLRIAVAAAALGSVLDPLVALHVDGAPIASADDDGPGRDPRLEVDAPPSGTLCVVVQDANDAGGDAHPYRLSIEAVAAEAEATATSFIGDVAPILQRRCVPCHGAGRVEGEWRADSLDSLVRAGASGTPAFRAGSREGSEGFARIVSDDPELRMPLDGEPLPVAEIDAIGRWIDAGLPFDGTSAAAALLEQLPAPVHPPAPDHYPTPPPVTALAFTPSGELLVGGWREVLLVDPSGGRVVRRIGDVAERSSRIAVHPSGDRFAVAGGLPGRLGEVRIFTLGGELLRVLARGEDVVHDVAWSPDGDRLAVASSDASVRIFDAGRGALLRTIAGHRDWVLAVAWSPDGGRIATGSRDRTAKVFSVVDGALLASYGRHDAPVRGVIFHPSGEEVHSAGDSRKWDRWRIADGSHVRDTHLGGEVFQLAGAGDCFAAPSADGRAHLFRAADSERVREFSPAASARLVSVAAHPAGDRLAAGTQDGRVVIWILSSGERVAEFPLRP